ncbi:hypothetical protein [Ornithobacterium rhinotracheale]|uniref:hypothetical protein n=1 Tax=Ornithobacterium rhinotracheale TaxID=28251 RepID=UPI001FF51A4D|nr:hypothetical protein [Ornithobacterium rhinotracheale]MCK0206067.1 hypothetical protein [Ornithobacterium rhinotracheale]
MAAIILLVKPFHATTPHWVEIYTLIAHHHSIAPAASAERKIAPRFPGFPPARALQSADFQYVLNLVNRLISVCNA